MCSILVNCLKCGTIYSFCEGLINRLNYIKGQIARFNAARIVRAAAEDIVFFYLLFLDFQSQAKPCLPSFVRFTYKTRQWIVFTSF